MRAITRIIIHCSATKENETYSIEQLKRDHLSRGFSDIGYHFYITREGMILSCRPLIKIGAHCKGFNSDSIGVCYEGGLDVYGKLKDTRTPLQKEALKGVVRDLKDIYPAINEVKGHRDYSPDLNEDGKITSNEWMKGCPGFNVETEL